MTLGGCSDGATSSGSPGAASGVQSGLPLGADHTAEAESAHAAASADSTGAESSANASARPGRGPAPSISLLELKARESAIRSIDDALFVEAGHAERAREDARRWAAELRADPKLLFDGGTAAFGVRLALDAATAPIILASIAQIDTADETGELATDFLDDLARRGDPAGRLTLLARDLRDLKKARSKALAVVLALDAITSTNCEGAKHLLGRVRAEGDSRALEGIARLGRPTGCGRKSDTDCFPCLRDRDAAKLFTSATEACRARPFKPPWRVRGDGF